MEDPTQPAVTTLDVRGLSCPLPVLKANKALRALDAGALLEVWATDPAALKDFPVFAEETGHRLEEVRQAGGHHVFLLRKRAA
ncbi:MAG: sulfurtransferase TusA family protein [Acetobacteraceae bacterium]|nr:sulfurtransferase TusA family protein [Acetobacteraceae bacterium]